MVKEGAVSITCMTLRDYQPQARHLINDLTVTACAFFPAVCCDLGRAGKQDVRLPLGFLTIAAILSVASPPADSVCSQEGMRNTIVG